ncbi:MAG TPA: RDD family protein [Acidimicrobiales bacterium]|nr:RDD family protein [Acidimicrobiales bacterium]
MTQPQWPGNDEQPGGWAPQPGGWAPQPGGPGGWAPGAPAGGAVAPEAYTDQGSGLMLPPGTMLASPGRRIGAYFLGLVLPIVTLGIGYVIWGAVVWARGQTPALQVLGMRCYRPDHRAVAGWGTMALREIIGRFVESLLFITLVVSFVLFLARRDHRSIHDLIASTVVVHDPNKVLAAP